MSIHQQVYANLDPIYFKLTKNGVGVPNQTFSTGDIYHSVDESAWVDVSANVTEYIGANQGKGIYKWTPSTGQTSGYVIVLNIDEAAGTNFDENCLIIVTGGNALARHRG